MLSEYIGAKFSKQNLSQVKKEDIVFFLGAFLYPKRLKKLINSNL